MPTLQQSFVHKSRKSATQITSPTFMICVMVFCDLYPQQSPQTLLWTLLPTFPVHCNELNSIRATQTGLSQTCHGLCRKHLDMSRLFLSATFMISWFITVCVHDFHDLCLWHSPLGSVVKSLRNGIWAYVLLLFLLLAVIKYVAWLLGVGPT